jgi:hypothetical protein
LTNKKLSNHMVSFTLASPFLMRSVGCSEVNS